VRRPTPPVAIALVAALGACGGGDGDGEEEGDKTQRPATGGGCKQVEQPRPEPDGGETRPKQALDPSGSYRVTLVTSCGEITIRLDPKASPDTSASFLSLARKGFFDGTAFHRIVPGFVIQGGDPTGTGSGGPGYSTRDVPSRDSAYTRGTVAMAKTAAEPPGTAGSQFYIVTGQDAQLPPEYAVLGRVVDGMDVAGEIDGLGEPSSGEQGVPLRPVVIERVRVDAS
jgi:peptidyl-prolyl cis-trans isomerase B (cyclophilin B)